MTYHIFLGYDIREKEAYQVAAHSLLKHSTVPLKIHPLKSKDLKKQGLLRREHKEDSSGQMIDLLDGRPFSTQFTFSRFLTPELWRNVQEEKSSLCMFVDGDFLWLQDIGEMFKEVEQQKILNNGRSPVYVVQHDYRPKSTVKMDGVEQSQYNMKLWSSCVVFDMDHPDNALLTPDVVNSAAGRDLHSFYWIKDTHTIGCLKEKWNFIPNHSETHTDDIGAIHYTEGIPAFREYRTCRYAGPWLKEYSEVLRDAITGVTFDTDKMLFNE